METTRRINLSTVPVRSQWSGGGGGGGGVWGSLIMAFLASIAGQNTSTNTAEVNSIGLFNHGKYWTYQCFNSMGAFSRGGGRGRDSNNGFYCFYSIERSTDTRDKLCGFVVYILLAMLVE